MIPKMIHYCWFGRNEKPELAQRCIASWRQHFPDHEIKEWNEDNFDVARIPFMRRAYENGQWAFVSDVARLMIVYEHGGIYFDTDVEVISDYEDILNGADGFLGREKSGFVATGLGFGACPGNPFLKELLDWYAALDFDLYKDKLSAIACPVITTRLMREHGLDNEDRLQSCCGFTVYPSEYFSPRDYATGRQTITGKTHSIHWYTASWHSEEERRSLRRVQKLRRICGEKTAWKIVGISKNIRKEGLFSYIAARIRRRIK